MQNIYILGKKNASTRVLNKMNTTLKDGISIMMPALNEEKNIGSSIIMVEELMSDLVLNYELIIINDGSNDNTLKIANDFAKKNPNITIINHTKPHGMGACYKEGLLLATMTHYMHIVSKNECDKNSIKELINARNMANIIIPYTKNMNERDFFRRHLSYFFTQLINILTGNKIKYYNGTVLYKTSIIRSINFNSSYHTFQCEALIRLLLKNNSYLELPVQVNWNRKHKSNAFKISNFISVFKLLINIIFKRLK